MSLFDALSLLVEVTLYRGARFVLLLVLSTLLRCALCQPISRSVCNLPIYIEIKACTAHLRLRSRLRPIGVRKWDSVVPGLLLRLVSRSWVEEILISSAAETFLATICNGQIVACSSSSSAQVSFGIGGDV